MNTDGSGAVEISLACALDTPKGIALDLVNDKMYVASAATASNGNIFRMNLDGTICEMLQSGLTDPTDIALDLAAGQMYWTSFNGGAIYRASLNGGAATTLISGLNSPAGLALDIPANNIYWVNFGGGSGTISRADLDVPIPADVTPIGFTNGPHDIALHLPLPVVWDGGGVDNNWSTGLNWSTDVVPTASDAVLFDATSAKDAVINTSASVAEMTIAAA
jgi:DNA-binding beta-propeller fold protein YncE